MTSIRIPIWKPGSLAFVAYLFALVTLAVVVKSENFWGELFASPRFRTGFVFYSSLFFVAGTVLMAAGYWAPTRTTFVIVRRFVVGVAVLSLILAVCLMHVFGEGFDWKLSGPQGITEALPTDLPLRMA